VVDATVSPFLWGRVRIGAGYSEIHPVRNVHQARPSEDCPLFPSFACALAKRGGVRPSERLAKRRSNLWLNKLPYPTLNHHTPSATNNTIDTLIAFFAVSLPCRRLAASSSAAKLKNLPPTPPNRRPQTRSENPLLFPFLLYCNAPIAWQALYR
jgi:hypothetical protein